MLDLPLHTRKALAEAIVLRCIATSSPTDQARRIHWDVLRPDIAPLLPEFDERRLLSVVAEFLGDLPPFEDADGKRVQWALHASASSHYIHADFRPQEVVERPDCCGC